MLIPWHSLVTDVRSVQMVLLFPFMTDRGNKQQIAQHVLKVRMKLYNNFRTLSKISKKSPSDDSLLHKNTIK